MKNINVQIQKAQQTPNRLNTKMWPIRASEGRY